MELEHVCRDIDSNWHYNPEDQKYYRMYEGRKAYTRISGVNLPDPEQLLASRIRNHVINGKDVDIDLIKPTEATYALYNHWLAKTASM